MGSQDQYCLRQCPWATATTTYSGTCRASRTGLLARSNRQASAEEAKPVTQSVSTQQTCQIRHVTCDNPSLGYANQKGSPCVNYGKNFGAPLGYDNQDHMQLAYTYTSYTRTEHIHAFSHLRDDFSCGSSARQATSDRLLLIYVSNTKTKATFESTSRCKLATKKRTYSIFIW